MDAGSGRKIWRFQRSRSKGLVGNAAGGIGRSVAADGPRVFIALYVETGKRHSYQFTPLLSRRRQPLTSHNPQ